MPVSPDVPASDTVRFATSLQTAGRVAAPIVMHADVSRAVGTELSPAEASVTESPRAGLTPTTSPDGAS